MTVLRGALLEYGTNKAMPYPKNLVLFQFNPDKLTRNIQIPQRPTPQSENNKAASQAGDTPYEKISLTAQLSAADDLAQNDPLARAFGVGPRLAALELMTMAKPSSKDSSLGVSLLSQNLLDGLNTLANPNPQNATSDTSIAASAGSPPPASSPGAQANPAPSSAPDKNGQATTPRLHYPKLLFVWGPWRILPVYIESMTITELQHDAALNPVEAEVALGLTVTTSAEDLMGVGAMVYTTLQKTAMAAGYLTQTASLCKDIIHF